MLFFPLQVVPVFSVYRSKIHSTGAEEIDQWLKALTSLTKDWGLIPNTDRVVDNHL